MMHAKLFKKSRRGESSGYLCVKVFELFVIGGNCSCCLTRTLNIFPYNSHRIYFIKQGVIFFEIDCFQANKIRK